MLGKLIKHEFRATGRTMLPILGVVLIMALLANLSSPGFEVTDVTIIQILLGLLFAFLFIGIIAAGVVALVVMINRFYKNVLGEEGYLTMTLPVSTHAIIWSKLIVSFVWFVATAIVALIAMFLTVAGIARMDLSYIFSNFPTLSEVLNDFYTFSGFNSSTMPVFVLEAVAYSFLSALVICLHFYASMAIGHGFKNRKVLMSVVFFIVISFIFQLLTIYVSPLFSFDSDGIYYETQLCTVLTRLVLSGMAIQGVQGIILYFITIFNLKTRLNLA